jgi:PAS domain S-box-containing protein
LVLLTAQHFRQQLEKARDFNAQQERRFRTFAATAPVGIFVLDAHTRFQYVNERWVGLTGVTMTEVIGRPWRAVMLASDVPMTREAWADLVADGRELCVDMRLQKPDRRSTWVTFSVKALYDGAGRPAGFIGSIVDISDRKEAQRLQGEFVTTVSHELRTPLTAIVGSLALVNGGATGPISAQARSLTEMAQRNCDRLVRLINDILDIEKLESGVMELACEPIDMDALIDRTIADNALVASQYQVHLVKDVAAPHAVVLGDEDRLLQVLTNLVANAAKFSPPGETVRIGLAYRPNGRVRIWVADHGEGIPTEFHSRIFQKFAQAGSKDGRAKGGTGLGLSIVKELVERMNGRIWFDSDPSGGTTFYVDLPGQNSDMRDRARALP